MGHRISMVLLVVLLIVSGKQLAAQEDYSNQIENTRAEIRNDTVIISFDINGFFPVEKAWVEIRTIDGQRIANNSLDGKVWDKVALGANRKIVWAYLNDGVDLSDKEIKIIVKADVLANGQMDAINNPIGGQVSLPNNPYGGSVNSQNNHFEPIVNELPNRKNIQKVPEEKPKKNRPTAKYPLLRPGIELGVNIDNASSSKATLSFEYIAKPWWSVHSGIGFEMAEVYDDTNLNYNTTVGTYGSILVPLTGELKLNAGRWFRIYGGGGILNRIVIIEEDPILNFDQGLNRYVFGAKADAGFEIRSIRIGVSYCKDFSSYSEFNEKMTAFNLVLGWRFGGGRAYIRN